ncbi:degenerate transposase [Streptococcus pneumoniae]|nr:degenerate transposase [Streptococcus pneumoniae]
MEQLHFITKLLDIKDPNIKILDIINMDTHKEIIAKLDYEAPSCPDCGSLMKKYDFQKPIISGSRAAFSIIVRPFALTAAIIVLIVAPTLTVSM